MTVLYDISLKEKYLLQTDSSMKHKLGNHKTHIWRIYDAFRGVEVFWGLFYIFLKILTGNTIPER